MTERLELGPPTSDDYELLKEAILEMTNADDVTKRPIHDGSKLYFSVERLYSDFDVWTWPLLMVRFSGIMTSFPGGSRMALRYREFALHPDTLNNSVNHDYILRQEEGEITEFGHSMRAAPIIAEPYDDTSETPIDMYRSKLGGEILRCYTGNQLELTAGDCMVLFDRVMDLTI